MNSAAVFVTTFLLAERVKLVKVVHGRAHTVENF
jgi:hypothetical protein